MDIHFKGQLEKDLSIDENGVLAKTTNWNCFSKKFQSLHSFFPHAPLIPCDPVIRPARNTTLFTSAGIQHLENIWTTRPLISRESFSIYQPCIRTQFINDITEGSSTAFTNFSSTLIDANYTDLLRYSKSFIDIIRSYGFKKEEVEGIVKAKDKNWGAKNFKTTAFVLKAKGLEVGRAVYMHDFPTADGKKMDILEVGLGVDRLRWQAGLTPYYFADHAKVYQEYADRLSKNEIANLIDLIHTSTLITASGALPSNHNQGYRTRCFLRKFVEDNYCANVDHNQLITDSYQSWAKNGLKPKLKLEQTSLIMTREIERNYNRFITNELGRYNIVSKLDINQPTNVFCQKLKYRVPAKILQQFNQYSVEKE